MDNENKRQSPYRGIWMILFLLIFVPACLFGLIYVALNHYQGHYGALNLASAKAIGCGLGCLFHLGCAVAGAFTPGWKALTYRIREFFESLIVSPAFAFESYWADMKNDGVVLLLELPIVIVNFCLALDGLMDALALL